MVHLEDVTDMMDQMMKVEIFQPSEKLRMSRTEEKTFLDPNLIMDARHRIFRENLSDSPTKCSILAEARRLLMQEETRELYLKREQQVLERELRKFQSELHKSGPKFSEHYMCSKVNFARSDDVEFWETHRRVRNEITGKSGNNRERGEDIKRRSKDRNTNTDDRTNEEIDNPTRKLENGNALKIVQEVPRIGSIKVTIKEKSNFESDKLHLCILRKCFDTLKSNAMEERRLRDIKTKIQQSVALRLKRKYFDLWRMYIENAKNISRKKKEEQEISEERKIEMFINAITEKQKQLMQDRKQKPGDANTIVGNTSSAEMKKRNIYRKHIIVESPAQSRLNAQKQVIEKQRAKLAEQNRIIEELKLKQAQSEILESGKETMNVAKETLAHCGQKTRRTLMQLMRQAGNRDKSLSVPERVPSPPKFLKRMEARAEARRERIKLAEEMRRKKFEEQKRKEEAARIEEEQKKKRLKQEAIREARRLREEHERNRLREIETFQRLNKIADEFYRKYLLRRYVMEPLMILVEQKNNNITRAVDHYKNSLKRTVFAAWKRETESHRRIQSQIAVSFYNRKLMSRAFEKWKSMTRQRSLKLQVAKDFYDMKLLDKFFKLWQITTHELKVQYKKKEQLAESHYENKLKLEYFAKWKKYPKIAAEMKESEKRKDELRQIVRKVIPDFNPKCI